MLIDGNNILSTGISYGGESMLTSILVTRCTDGIRCEVGNNSGVFRDVTCLENARYGLAVIRNTTNDNTIMTFEACKFRWNGTTSSGAGCYLENEQRCLFTSCVFESNYSYGLYIKYTALAGDGGAPLQTCTFLNCWFEANATNASGEYRYAVYSDADSAAHAPNQFHFLGCTFSCVNTARAIKLVYGKWFVFENLNLRGGDENNLIQLASTALNNLFLYRNTYEYTPPNDQPVITNMGTDTVEIRSVPSLGYQLDGRVTVTGPAGMLKFKDYGTTEIMTFVTPGVSGGGLTILDNADATKFQFYNDGRFGMKQTRTPASSGAAGSVGDIAWDDNYFYVRQSTGWRRISLGAAF